MTYNSGELLYEGKAKRIFKTDHVDEVLVEFKNDTTAFNAVKRVQLDEKGLMNCQISACLFEVLGDQGVPNHYLGLASDVSMVAQRVKVIPLEVVIRNIAAGSFCKQMPIALGTELPSPLLDLYYKDDSLADPLLSEARLEILDLVTFEQRSQLSKIALQVNSILSSFFSQLDLTLVDFKLEFGINSSGKILLADEISPDTCRLWDQRIEDPQDRILDKDRFRQNLGGVVDAYREVLKRVHSVCAKPRFYK